MQAPAHHTSMSKAPHHLRKRTKYREGIKPTGSIQGNCSSARTATRLPARCRRALAAYGLLIGNPGKATEAANGRDQRHRNESARAEVDGRRASRPFGRLLPQHKRRLACSCSLDFGGYRPRGSKLGAGPLAPRLRRAAAEALVSCLQRMGRRQAERGDVPANLHQQVSANGDSASQEKRSSLRVPAKRDSSSRVPPKSAPSIYPITCRARKALRSQVALRARSPAW